MSSAINYGLTSIVSFFLNKHWTFGAKGWSVFMLLAFVLTIIVSYLSAYSIARPLVYRILQGQSQKIRDNISLFAGMCFFAGINYFGQRFVAFRGGKT
jgi:putative flippase GtrA